VVPAVDVDSLSGIEAVVVDGQLLVVDRAGAGVVVVVRFGGIVGATVGRGTVALGVLNRDFMWQEQSCI
jgi:hypothetical protein